MWPKAARGAPALCLGRSLAALDFQGCLQQHGPQGCLCQGLAMTLGSPDQNVIRHRMSSLQNPSSSAVRANTAALALAMPLGSFGWQSEKDFHGDAMKQDKSAEMQCNIDSDFMTEDGCCSLRPRVQECVQHPVS